MKRLLPILLLLLVSGCGAKSRVVQAPVREKVQEELREVKLEGDSSLLRMVFEQPLSAIREVRYQQGKNSLTPDIRYHIKHDTITVVAEVPEQVVEVVERTITQEVPIEVEVEREVNILHWWQKTLMWVGALVLLSLIIRVIVKYKVR